MSEEILFFFGLKKIVLKKQRERFSYQSLLSNTTEAQYSLYVVCAKQIFNFPPTLAARGENADFSTKKCMCERGLRQLVAKLFLGFAVPTQYFKIVPTSESSKHESIKEVSCPLIFLISNTHEIHIFKFFRTVILG